MTIKKYQAGDTVYITRDKRSTFPKADTTATVVTTFVGKDSEDYLVVEYMDRRYGGDPVVRYECLSWKNIYDTMDGDSNFMKAYKDPNTRIAHNMLVSAGIIDDDGNLTDSYR